MEAAKAKSRKGHAVGGQSRGGNETAKTSKTQEIGSDRNTCKESVLFDWI